MMQWEKRKVNEEISKLLGEIYSLEDSIDARDKTIANLLEIANKAEHDRDRYKRRIEKMQKNQPRYIITPKIPKNITLNDLLKNTYIVENWDNSVEIIPPREEIEKAIAKKILKWLKEHSDFVGFALIETYFREEFGVEIGE